MSFHDTGSEVGHESTDQLARLFFNEDHNVTKERFFLSCCGSWMDELVVAKADGTYQVTYEVLWETLKRIYSLSKCTTNDDPSLISWILPDLPQASLMDPDSNNFQAMGIDGKYRACIMDFWRDIFKACEEGSSGLQNYKNDEETKRPAKRQRRLGSTFSASSGYTNLIKGRYKLPAVYLMISLYEEIGKATDWTRLCDLAHELPSTFKTFVESDVLAGLALVGLVNIQTGNLLAGLSASDLIWEYFLGMDSYGPSIFCILNDATSLNIYNLRASVCRQVLNHLESHYDDSDGEYESNIIDACAACIDQERPERFIDNLQARGKRRFDTKSRMKSQYIPDRFASPGYPLLIHIQICLLRHEVERAAYITRKMDSSSCLSDEVRDKAWFSVWWYLLSEGILFLDGNTGSEYLKKRDFLYTYMACQVSQNAKQAMMDFYQEVANRICENDDSTLEEKQYVIFACQQTVLRLLFKIRGLGIKTILEFVRETKWPTEIPGLKSHKDLNLWSTDFLLQIREIPTSLIDEATGLIDLHKRLEGAVETQGMINFDSSMTPSREKALMTESSAAEKLSNEENDDNRSQIPSPATDAAVQNHESIGIAQSSMLEAFHKENESDQRSEIYEEEEEDEDDGVVVLDDDDDDDDDEIIVEDEGELEIVEVEDDDEISRSNDQLSYSDDNEDHGYPVGEAVYPDDENTGSDDNNERYDEEGETDHGDGESTSSDEKIIESANDFDDTHEESEDDLSDGGFAQKRRFESDQTNKHPEESEIVELDVDDANEDDVYRANTSIDLNSGDHDHNDTSQKDTLPDRDAPGEKGDASDRESAIDGDGTEMADDTELSPFLQTANNENESKNDRDDRGQEYPQLQKTHNRTKATGVGGEFGDTTEEEDGSDRLRANNIAQADRRADALRAGLGYASQVEDGYEPEDTHGYTEEEVSEAIHTEDEEDENTVKQKTTLSDTDTSHHHAVHESHTDKEELSLPLSGRPQDNVENADRQNSIEPASDDMDMADEHTEQEEDVAAEFSELEENPEGSSESPKISSKSTQAKTLLEFAQKAQNKDNWGNLKDDEVESTTNVELARAGHGGLVQNSELTKNIALSFDADDEKYATEGCKSLETEEEEDTEKEGDLDAKVDAEIEVEAEAEENNSDDSTSELVVQDDMDEASINEGSGKGDTVTTSINMDIAEGEARDVDIHETASEAVESEKIELHDKTDNLLPETNLTEKNEPKNDDSELMVMEKEPLDIKDSDTKMDDVAFEEHGEPSKNDTAVAEDDMMVHEGNADENGNQNNEQSMQVVEDKLSSSDSGISSPVNTKPKHDNNEGFESTDITLVEGADVAGANEGKVNDEAFAANEDDCAEPIVAQDNLTDERVNETGGITGIRSNLEDGDQKSLKESHESEIEESDADGFHQSDVEMDKEITDGAAGNSNQETADQESTLEQSNQNNIEDDGLGDGSIGGVNNDDVPMESDGADIPRVIGGDPEQVQLLPTRRSKRATRSKYKATNDADGQSLGMNSQNNGDDGSIVSGASVISEIFRSETREGVTVEEDDRADNKSEESAEKSAKKGKTSAPTGAATRSSRRPTRSSTRSASAAASKTVEEQNEASLALKTRKTRAGLPPRPPNETRGRATRSKKLNDDELSVQTVTSTRSTRSSARKQSSVSKALERKDKKSSRDNDDDDASVQSTMSVRSTRSAARKTSKEKEMKGDDDDASVQTTSSVRSTRSSTKTRGSKQKEKEASNEKKEDDASVQSGASSRRSTRSTRASSRKSKGNDNNDDDESVQTTTSTMSTRRSKRNQSAANATKGKNDPNGMTVKQLQAALKKNGISFPSKAKKKVLVDLYQENIQK